MLTDFVRSVMIHQLGIGLRSIIIPRESCENTWKISESCFDLMMIQEHRAWQLFSLLFNLYSYNANTTFHDWIVASRSIDLFDLQNTESLHHVIQEVLGAEDWNL